MKKVLVIAPHPNDETLAAGELYYATKRKWMKCIA